jgi:hypothetical protein
MTKKVTLNYDFIAVAIIAFILLAGYNIYQYSRYEKLFTEHVDLIWTAQNAEANVVYTRKQLESCKNSANTGI